MMVRLMLISGMLLASGNLSAQVKSALLDPVDMAGNLEEALTFQKYATYPQYVDMMRYFVDSYPGTCRLDTFGTSEQGRLLLALKISDNAAEEEAEPRFLYTATMHGNELVGYPLMLRLVHYLLSNYGTDSEVTALVNNLAIWINPLSNPDATFYPDNDQSVALSIRQTSNGTDLNRDFPRVVDGDPDDTTGRARETRMMMEFLRENRFTMSANIHSGAEVVNYPWDYTLDRHADDSWFRFVSREYADEARAVDPGYMALFTDGISNGADWYIIHGSRQDYVTWYLGGREVTLELAEEYRMDSELLDWHWQINARSLLNYMAQCMYGITGTVTDRETGKVLTDPGTGEPVSALISIPGHDSTYSMVRTTTAFGDYYRPVEAGAFDLVASAPGYLNDTVHGVETDWYTTTRVDFQLERERKSGTGAELALEGTRIWPNPFRDLFYIDPGTGGPGSTGTGGPGSTGTGGPGSTGTREMIVEIHTLTGVTVYGEIHDRDAGTIGISPGNLPPGLYLLRLSTPDGSRVFRIVKY